MYPLASLAREPLPTEPPEPPPCPPGWHTGPPDFVGVGAQRCGSSWWFRAIRSQPQVEPSPLGKETHYFDCFWAQKPPPDLAEGYGALFPRPEGRITGEWTPRYMSDLSSIRLLRDAAPEARILAMLRDPVERYRSAVARFGRLFAEEGQTRYPVDYSEAVWRGAR